MRALNPKHVKHPFDLTTKNHTACQVYTSKGGKLEALRTINEKIDRVETNIQEHEQRKADLEAEGRRIAETLLADGPNKKSENKLAGIQKEINHIAAKLDTAPAILAGLRETKTQLIKGIKERDRQQQFKVKERIRNSGPLLHQYQNEAYEALGRCAALWSLYHGIPNTIMRPDVFSSKVLDFQKLRQETIRQEGILIERMKHD